jgi:branched-chain amino acid transport system ATP-binding protein
MDVSGFLPAEDVVVTEGMISFGGQSLRGLLPHQISRLGVVLVPEREKLFQTLTVKENLDFSLTRKRRPIRDAVYDYFPKLAERHGQVAGYLSGGEKQMLAIGMAMLIVEQNAAAALRVASFGYVLESGRVVFKGEAEKLLKHQDMREFYLGDPKAGSYRNIRQYTRKRRWWG